MKFIFNFTVLVLLIIMFSLQDLLGQINNYEKGEIVTAGEVKEGFINVRDDLLMNLRIEFKSNIDDEPVAYYPKQLLSYSLLISEEDYQVINHEYTSDEGKDIVDQRFARKLFYNDSLVLFKVNLQVDEYEYKYAKKMPEHVYYILNISTNRIHKLEVIEKLFEGISFRKVNSYKGVLKYLLRDWDKSGSKVDKLEFNDDEFIDLLEEYSNTNTQLKSKKYLRKKSDFVEKSFLINVGYAPFSIPKSVSHRFGYLVELKYQFLNRAKFFPAFQVGIDYLDLRFENIESAIGIPTRTFERFHQYRFMAGSKIDLYTSNNNLSLYVRVAAGLGIRKYTFQSEQIVGNSIRFVDSSFDEAVPTFNIGAGIFKSNISFDVGLERVAYSFSRVTTSSLLSSYIPMIRVGYKITI